MTARGQSICISIAMLPQTFWGDMEAITVQKTSKYSKTYLKRNAIIPVFFFRFSQVSILQRVVF